MSMTGIIMAAAIVGGLGLFIGAFLGLAGKKFAVETDPREEAILDVLPGNNCGGCGYAGCAGLAAAIISGEAKMEGCPVGGAEVATKIAEIMGQEAKEQIPMTAFVKCAGTCEKAVQDYQYTGVKDCRAVSYMQNQGPKTCKYGCMGFGTCVSVCPFDAIHVIDGIAVVDREACKACGKCVEACPRLLIELVPHEQSHLVQCNSKDKGKEVTKACKAGCIGCKMCEKVCPSGAIAVEHNIAHIDFETCTDCGLCVEKCPRKIIL